LRLKATHSKPQ